MATKSEIIDKLTELGIDHDPNATKADLEALLPEGGDEAEDERESQVISGIEVRDPYILKPKELPLVIPTPEGGWANEQQAEYAKVLNAYAYKNPAKWEEKKADREHTDTQGRKKVIKGLVTQLSELAKSPELFYVFVGGKPEENKRLEYNNKRIMR